MPSDHFAWPETRSETAAKPAAVNRFFFSFFLDFFFLWMDKQSESRRVRELDRVRQCDNCQWDKTNWFIMNDSSRANKLHADTGKMHLEKRKTERKRSEARDVERCFIFMRPASEIAALALESTTDRITITKEIAHCSASRYPVKGLHVLNG